MLVSEIGSLSLEFTRLSQLTGDPKYYDAIQRIYNEFEKSQSSTLLPGMWPVTVNAEAPSFNEDNFFTLGGMSDSLYEYLPKQYMLLGGLLDQQKTLYENFIEVAKTHLFYRIYNPKDKQISMSGDIRVKGTESGVKSDIEIKLKPRGQHLTCFVGGMVAIASKIFSRPNDLSLAEELTDGCVWAYDGSPNGIAPEIFTTMPCPKTGDCHWNETIWHAQLVETYGNTNADLTLEELTTRAQKIVHDHNFHPGFTAIDDRKYILRPEAIESVFILYRITGHQKYQDAAWRMFEAVEKATRTTIAAAGTADITVPRGEATMLDSMESFWLAETLKYFYLCFEEWGVVSLDEWVLNTEAHPLKRLR
jgi:mannosyl-oligosaccharide alpha-1,2-mannosidase